MGISETTLIIHVQEKMKVSKSIQLIDYNNYYLRKHRSGGNPITIAYCNGIVMTTKNIKIIHTFAKVSLDNITKVINHNA